MEMTLAYGPVLASAYLAWRLERLTLLQDLVMFLSFLALPLALSRFMLHEKAQLILREIEGPDKWRTEATKHS